MKRDPSYLAVSDASLDVLDDFMWDELRDLSPPSPLTASFESRVAPIDVISGVGPIKSSNVQMNALSWPAGGALTLVRGDNQESLTPLAGGGASFDLGLDTAQLNELWAETKRDTAFVPLWTASSTRNSTSATLSDSSLPQSSTAAEIRRRKNREWMRKSRQKQREELENMKITVSRLERQYAELSLQSSSDNTLKSGGGALISSRMVSDYSQAVELARRLGAENLYLKSEIQRRSTWKLNLSRVLQSSTHVNGPKWAQQFQQPALGGEEVLRMQLDTLDDFEAQEEFGFHTLTDLDLTRAILENRRTISRVQSRLLIPSSLDTDYGAKTRRMQTFGWEMVQRVHGNIMECVFTKKLHGLNVAELMQKTWANDMRLGEYKKVKGETCRLEVLQQVNPNAYAVGRDVKSPTPDIATFRSVYVRFLIETSRKLAAVREDTATPSCIDASAPSTLSSDSENEGGMLQASGFVLGSQSVDTDYSLHPRDEDIRDRVAWAHISLSIEFLNVVNPVTRDEFQQLRWSGRTDYCGPEHAQRNASDMMQGLLRWELLVISPALNLSC
ncbi:hypothetical protein PF008_g26103 [Phytophthora fragariae]|uniref:BZIP domain-containing protein n=1 Tax=Phytophthora fragariae TaxID=53985 RepID=A0A6G0QIY8_9STRA|nr:hypothetical protein PF008_g26103 [Phytophthora fragariae]